MTRDEPRWRIVTVTLATEDPPLETAPDHSDNPVSRETDLRSVRLAVINQKGGVGKTTTAVNLAHGLARQGLRVLLVDLDPQGNATTALGIDKYADNPSSYDLLFKGPHEARWTPTKYEKFDLYPANIGLIRAELDLLQRGDDRQVVLKKALDQMEFPHNVIIFDSPPSLGILTLNILITSDAVMVPVQCEFLALEGLSMLLETLEEIKETHNPLLYSLGCLVTMVDLRTNLSQQVVSDLRENLGDQVFESMIPRTVRLSECPSHGKTIFEYERWGTGARAYEALSREVIDRLGIENPNKAAKS